MRKKNSKTKNPVKQLTASPSTLLDYSNSTNPFPLQCSTATPETGKIIIKIVPPKGMTIYCERILVNIPYDNKGSTDKANTVFYLNATSEISGDTNWGPARIRKVQGSTEDDLDYLEFEIVNNYTDYKVPKSFELTITGIINKVAGSPKVLIYEYSSDKDDENFQIKEHSFTVQKSDVPILYLRNLVTVKSGSPLIPCTEFSPGTAIQVDWDTNATDVKLYNKNKSVALVKGENSITIKEGISTDSTLLLIATLGKKTLTESIHITVSSPELTPNSVVNSGYHIIKGNLK